MDWADVFKLITASIASIGVAGGLIFALSSWLGKVWARRILDREKNELDRELEAKKRELDIFKDTYLRTHNDKLVIYRAVIDSVAKLLAAFDAHQSGRLQPHRRLKHSTCLISNAFRYMATWGCSLLSP